ncbi:MAG: hypothetical protein JWO42_1935 [Chloroflexi bacterium]|nr:hypothetical protein [Chloroflexota bacterium]
MTQTKYSVLVSVFLLLLLTAGFFLAARVLLNKLHSSVATAVATPSATAFIQPTATFTAAPTAKGSSQHPPTAEPTKTPAPQTAQVVTNISGTMTNPMSSIPSDTNQVFCLAKLPGVPIGTPIRFRFQKLSAPDDYYHQDEQADGGTKLAWIYGPLQPGQWRCLVEANQKPVGTAAFTIH